MEPEPGSGPPQPWRWLASLVAALLFAGLCQSSPAGARAAAIGIHDAWIRWLPAGIPAGGYLTLRNDGDRAAVLTGVSSPDYTDISLHRSVTRGGVAAMEPVAQIVVPAHQSLQFAAGGYHLMLSHPTRAVRPGDEVRIDFHFSDGTIAGAGFEVRAPDASGGPR